MKGGGGVVGSNPSTDISNNLTFADKKKVNKKDETISTFKSPSSQGLRLLVFMDEDIGYVCTYDQ